jgi:hypothetical protein
MISARASAALRSTSQLSPIGATSILVSSWARRRTNDVAKAASTHQLEMKRDVHPELSVTLRRAQDDVIMVARRI